MVMKRVSRRDFLKLLAAGTAAAGLSHFRLLNPGGVQPVGAVGCSVLPDTCSLGVLDTCNPSDPPADSCFVTEGNADHCGEVAGMDQVPDACMPPTDPDVCMPPGNPDECLPGLDPDICAPPEDPDLCAPPMEPDLCAPPAEPDLCDPLAPEPDECTAAVPTDDMCGNQGYTDTCTNDNPDICGAQGNPDTCEGGQTPDICDPGAGDLDNPNAVSLRNARGVSSLITTLGGAAAALALGAALTGTKKS